MATAKKCDRCGEYYDYDDVEFSLIKTLYYNEIFGNKNDIDLCPDCCEQFNKWLNNKDMRPYAIHNNVMGTTIEK